MPRAFNERERNLIKERIRKAAASLMIRNGVRHTTIDAIVKSAMIPKGTFYLFYATKEELLFEVLENEHEKMEKSILEQISKVNPSTINPDSATELIYSFYKMVDEHPLLATISREDVTLISQRLPEERISKHLEEDRNMSAKLMRFLPLKDGITVETVSSSLHAIYFTMLHLKETADDKSEELLKLIIRGIMIQILR
ncbi:TetR/AcrR family transcriptional regulator [Bullifex porci]|uniref:TetR/AcrR family transcriptional regulator n=1 Tax=Bullifex porci TaxID=2606638 RepID=A0A7X2TRS2_9SPIO|nr:TetR/AcrR family transcriptional regulator [Bullifex porci]MDD7256110.1 TetR/AcrR family transcriptional regulator [Bullifex porci]MDY2740367.1 TetR/AcrR family transcriptional regulator [Bullifex porci]MSU07192.1 TetR/AcrR family transcriptional regulator [Bullifex porci]